MNGPAHWGEADQILTGESCDYGCPHTGCAHEAAYLARAQVHATLALAAVVVAAGNMRPDDQAEWDRVIAADSAAVR